MHPENYAITALTDSFKGLFPFTQEEQNAFASRFVQKNVKRRGFVLQEGDICKHFTFIVSGLCKQYVTDRDGKEHNLQFIAESDWITDMTSFYAEKPSHLNIEALEPSVILQIAHDDLLDLYNKYHRVDHNFRVIIEQKYIALEERVLHNISLPADERYEQFLIKYQHLSNRLPNTQIASYLGITPEFLSRIKGGIARNH